MDPVDLKNQEERSRSGLIGRILWAILQFAWKTLASLVSIAIFIAYFIMFYYFFYGRRMYDEFWQGMANQYQELPEDRIYMVHLTDEKRAFWEKLRFSCRVMRCVNGVLINSMFKIKKIEGQIDPQDYIFDNHMFEVEGRYAIKDKLIVDNKAVEALLKSTTSDVKLDITGTSSGLTSGVEALDYPDELDDLENRKVRHFRNDLSHKLSTSTEYKKKKKEDLEKEKKNLTNFIKRNIATRNAAYYPFIINLPMELNKDDKIVIDEQSVQRTWFYFEVEVVRRVGMGTNFVIGLLPAPYGEVTNGDQIELELFKPIEEFNFIDPEKTEDAKAYTLNFEEGKLEQLKQPEWVTSHLMNITKSGSEVAKGVKYLQEWKTIVPGELPDTVGFDITTGKLKVSGGLEWIMDVEEFMKGIYEPDNIYKTGQPYKSMAQQEEENAKKMVDEDDEGPHYVGDSFGFAYNAKTGYVFLTYNGVVINKLADSINTAINMAVITKYDEEEKQFDIEKERKQMEHANYFKKLPLDNNTKRKIDVKNLIKINTSVKYIPCIYTDQNTKFRVNFGATAFRNTQPEFAAGLLYPVEEINTYDYMDKVYDDQLVKVQDKNKF